MQMRSVGRTSRVKSTWPGVSMMLMRWSFQVHVVAAEVMVIPLSCSWAIQSMVAAPSCTSPICTQKAHSEFSSLGTCCSASPISPPGPSSPWWLRPRAPPQSAEDNDNLNLATCCIAGPSTLMRMSRNDLRMPETILESH